LVKVLISSEKEEEKHLEKPWEFTLTRLATNNTIRNLVSSLFM
jgi:hypothetical protein